MEDTLRAMTSEQPLALTVAEAAKVAGARQPARSLR
jgi:hypothetical protein